MPKAFRTARLLFRPLEPSDRAAFLRFHEISREHFRPWNPAPPPGETLDQKFDAELERIAKDHGEGTGARRAGFLADGRLAGTFNLSMIFRRDFLNCYAGWTVAADCIDQGIGTEGVTAMLDLAFAPEPLGLGLHRVQANIIPRNLASRRVAEKAGFRLEGHALRYLRIAGAWEDNLMFGKTAEEHVPVYLGR
jgi:ribosomal-protein-alanine N-acetyltransferase